MSVVRLKSAVAVMCFVRWVHGYPAGEKLVCCREGDEPLLAQGFIYGWQEPDDALKNTELLQSREHWQYLRALAGQLRRNGALRADPPCMGGARTRRRRDPAVPASRKARDKTSLTFLKLARVLSA